MTPCDIVVMGASSGGIDAVLRVVSVLPADFPSPVFVVIHVAPLTPSVLPQILSRQSRLRAVHPTDGDVIRPGTIYVAPPDRHLVLGATNIKLTSGPPECRHRPSIDVLFRSAAAAFAERVVGVILTGALDDGAAGLASIRARGGVTIVQDPGEATYPSMPAAAISVAAPHHILRLDAIGPKLVELVKQRQTHPSATGQSGSSGAGSVTSS